MNERILEIAIEARKYAESKPDIYQVAYDKKFAELIYKDIITVVAAQALMNESALDVFKNLRKLYEGIEE